VLSAGTANGVTYLNGSKSLTSGTGLVFDGTNLGIGVTPTYKLDVTGTSSVERVARFTSVGTDVNAILELTPTGVANGIVNATTTGLGLAVAGSTKVNVLASGNVGIGTSSPSYKLDVQKAGSNYQRTYNTLNNTAGWIAQNTTTSSEFGIDATGAYVAANGAYPITFQTNSSERARIDSSGNFLAGTTSALATTTHSFVANGASSGAPMASRNQGATAGKYWTFGPDTSNNYRVFNNGGTGMYMVDGATAWTATSDERKKDIIEPIVDATNKVSSLRAVIGKYKTDENGVRRSFLIAQDVQAVFPEAVNASNPDELGVQYTDVIPLLVAAIKEQQILITTLTARITALESK